MSDQQTTTDENGAGDQTALPGMEIEGPTAYLLIVDAHGIEYPVITEGMTERDAIETLPLLTPRRESIDYEQLSE